ncbi:hypothetical protein [Brevibacillus dissolubilis]|uniref:hypothetical protein n=1 Tax=Brevibacillus dissolubilis TaxID=1844116 RepID=UPI001117A952|nr:hypothetical protein [Brevibacillus dissolubilis]
MKLRTLLTHALVFALVLTAPLTALAEQETWSQALSQQIHTWMTQLAQKDKQFAPWQDATVKVEALGPGSHQWLVTIHKDGNQLGYMVVGEVPAPETPEGQAPQVESRTPDFALMEYGLGEYLLFDEAISPMRSSAQLIYDGLSSFWEVAEHDTIQYYDAKTGEKYPSIAKPDSFVMPTLGADKLINSQDSLQTVKTLSTQPADPFATSDWMMSKPLQPTQQSPLTWQQVINAQAAKPVIFTANLFQDEVLAPFSIGSVHVWDDTAYIGVWDEGLRFLPSSYMEKVGHLFVQ